MKLGIGLQIYSETPLHLNRWPIDFALPLFCASTLTFDEIKTHLPHLELRGETLLSPHHYNNRYLWQRHAQRLQGKTKLESEHYITNDILSKIERRCDRIVRWECFNELIKDKGNPRKCALWGQEFYPSLLAQIRAKFPHLTLLYSDYNYSSLAKASAIAELVKELKLDGVCIQLHLSIFSFRWLTFIANGRLEALIQTYKNQGLAVDITEVSIRLAVPHNLFAIQLENCRQQSWLKDFLHEKALHSIPVEFRAEYQCFLWQKLIEITERAGADYFYGFKTDRDFPIECDRPTLVDRDFNWKLPGFAGVLSSKF